MFVLLYFTPPSPNALFYKVFVIIIMVEYVCIYICIFVMITMFPKKKYQYLSGVKISQNWTHSFICKRVPKLPLSFCQIKYIPNIRVIIFSLEHICLMDIYLCILTCLYLKHYCQSVFIDNIYYIIHMCIELSIMSFSHILMHYYFAFQVISCIIIIIILSLHACVCDCLCVCVCRYKY